MIRHLPRPRVREGVFFDGDLCCQDWSRWGDRRDKGGCGRICRRFQSVASFSRFGRDRQTLFGFENDTWTGSG